MSPNIDVLIAGAGPTGLLLAGDLARAGLRVKILERRTEESNLTRAFVVHARTLELLDARGVADELIQTGEVVKVLQLFGALDLDLTRLPSRFAYLLNTPQYNVERVLEERAVAHGARIVRGAQVVGLSQDAEGVDVENADGSWFRSRFLVGADGVHSAVRGALGVPYKGRSPVKSMMLADVRLAEAPERSLVVKTADEGFAFIASFGDGWYRIFGWDRRRQFPDTTPVTFEEVREITELCFGTDFGMHDARWMSRFHSDERQASHYRVGRVFLVGDAAHCHSPAGGQGLNTGIGDAANLGWKLAAAVRGWAPEELLDSYQAERHPVGAEVIKNSSMLLTLAMGTHSWVRAARKVIPAVLGDIRSLNLRLAETMSGIGIGYHGAGERAADVPLVPGGPSRLYEALRTGRLTLMTHGELPAAWAEHVDAVTPADPEVPATLVRPDGYIAWVGSEPPSLTSILAAEG